ncbi:MAG: polyhydroxyalkanoate depolymerase, partial [Parvularculaceae bacterium]
MLYTAYELAYAAVAPARIAAGVGARFWRSPLNPAADSWFGRSAAAALDVFENVMRRYPKPEWDIHDTVLNGVEIPVTINEAVKKDFCTLLHFEREAGALKKAKGSSVPDPKVLIVAPLSGHY